jgi:mono/diheme cytochrome c family protein
MAVLAALVVVTGAGLLVFVRGMGVSARRAAPIVEQRLAKATWRFLVPPAIRNAENPVPNSREVLDRALQHFADHCAMCHANDGSGDTTLGRNTFPPAPDMAATGTQGLTDGELFYAIDQGIPWSAMPAWGNGTAEGERDTWEIVRFVRHLPEITPAELKTMEGFNPRSPVDRDREQEIDEFLQGGGP